METLQIAVRDSLGCAFWSKGGGCLAADRRALTPQRTVELGEVVAEEAVLELLLGVLLVVDVLDACVLVEVVADVIRWGVAARILKVNEVDLV